MRKKTMNNFFDNLMWYMIYLLPLVLFVLVSFRIGQFTSLSNCFDLIGLNVSNSFIYQTFNDLFGANGVVNLFNNTDILLYFTYFVSVYVCHLAVDFLLFIPRLSHKWLKSFTSGGAD